MILNNDAYNALQKISSKTKMDCWFSLGEDDEGQDIVIDLENDEKQTPIRDGLIDLVEGMVEPPENEFYGLSEREIIEFNKLVEELKIESHFGWKEEEPIKRDLQYLTDALETTEDSEIIESSLNHLIVTLKDMKLISTKNITDKWHTFGDLYNHRMAFTIALCNTINKLNWALKFINDDNEITKCTEYVPEVYCYKSKRHHNNEKDPMFEGSFIVVIETPNGQISYHYNIEHWDKFKIEERYEPNPYDGHTPEDTIVRLTKIY